MNFDTYYLSSRLAVFALLLTATLSAWGQDPCDPREPNPNLYIQSVLLDGNPAPFFIQTDTDHTLTLTARSNPEEMAKYWRVWIDWNGDGEFDNNTETVYRSESAEFASSITVNFISPDYFPFPESTQMMVSLGTSAIEDPCGGDDTQVFDLIRRAPRTVVVADGPGGRNANPLNDPCVYKIGGNISFVANLTNVPIQYLSPQATEYYFRVYIYDNSYLNNLVDTREGLPEAVSQAQYDMNVIYPHASGVNHYYYAFQLWELSSGSLGVYSGYTRYWDAPICPNNGNGSIGQGSREGRVFIAEESEELSVSLYPNPLTDRAMLTYAAPNSVDVSVRLYSNQFQMLKQWEKMSSQGNTSTLKLSIPDLPAGMYVLAVQAGKDQQWIKFVKQ